MIRLLGSRKRLCQGPTRRDLLHLGGLALFGAGLSDLLCLRQAQAAGSGPDHFGKAKACILLYKYGSPSQHETFDPKPEAPAEIQRSEERRVGKECRSRWARKHEERKEQRRT